MTVPSQMSLRRIPDALHLQVRVGYAASWEALIDTHTRQALQFVTEFASRIPVLEGLDLYFRVTAVPEGMHEVVRSRTLTALDLKTAAAAHGAAGPHRVAAAPARSRRSSSSAIAAATASARWSWPGWSGARAAEAVVATHVENALELRVAAAGASCR